MKVPEQAVSLVYQERIFVPNNGPIKDTNEQIPRGWRLANFEILAVCDDHIRNGRNVICRYTVWRWMRDNRDRHSK